MNNIKMKKEDIMGLNGEKMLQSLKHLSQVDKMKQVEPMSYALFPGYHCPLMGAMLTIRAIKDSVMLVLGPDECAYYTKMATSGNGSMSADGCQIVSVVLEQHDVTFGCQEKLEEAMEELNDDGTKYKVKVNQFFFKKENNKNQ